MIRQTLSRIGARLASFFRCGPSAPVSAADSVQAGEGPPFAPARYVRVHPKLAAMIAVALRGWSPRFAAKPRRTWSKPHQGAQECARRVRQMMRDGVRPVSTACHCKHIGRPHSPSECAPVREYWKRQPPRVSRGAVPALGLSALALTGCASGPELSRTEIAWQALHAVDVVQTIKGPAQDPCFNESHPVTRSFIGEHPDTGKVIAWGVGSAFAHAWVSSYLEERAPRVAKVWQFVTFADVGYAVANNHALGIRIGSPNKTPAGCNR